MASVILLFEPPILVSSTGLDRLDPSEDNSRHWPCLLIIEWHRPEDPGSAPAVVVVVVVAAVPRPPPSHSTWGVLLLWFWVVVGTRGNIVPPGHKFPSRNPTSIPPPFRLGQGGGGGGDHCGGEISWPRLERPESRRAGRSSCCSCFYWGWWW